ncbi:hypothetical protein HZ326_6502 [Fusarium oxysporum f. sp. albedinis]|nr:hypothetical protein HZ326_6502 [Fusarium oxysporum f. sp. albedinis]
MRLITGISLGNATKLTLTILVGYTNTLFHHLNYGTILYRDILNPKPEQLSTNQSHARLAQSVERETLTNKWNFIFMISEVRVLCQSDMLLKC